MPGHGEKFSHKAERLIAALLEESSILEAAKRAGINEKTARRWLHNPDFQARYQEAKLEIVSVGLSRLQSLTALATDTLRLVMTDADAGATAKVNAGKAVLELALRVSEGEDLATRVAALEGLAKQLLETIAWQRTFGVTGALSNGYHQPSR